MQVSQYFGFGYRAFSGSFFRNFSTNPLKVKNESLKGEKQYV
jgi:hypothetical protein